MKKRIPAFLVGMLTMALVGSLGIGALAATGSFTITVNPINIQVNGETFQPKNAKGEDVPVFAYDGTTYAPLRALAEAYGLEVGYDAEANMATVGEKTTTPEPEPTASPTDYSDWTAEEEAAYQEFKGMWKVKHELTKYGSGIALNCYKTVDAASNSDAVRAGEAAVDTFLSEHTVGFIEKCCLRFDSELYDQYEESEIQYKFTLWGSWGWLDVFSSGVWECGYKSFLDYTS